jgi:small subunit ribosomal protein S9
VTKPLIQTTGRRKESIARVRLRPGTGVIKINGREFEQYFPILTHQVVATEPLRLTQTADVYDVEASLDGGGVSRRAAPRNRAGSRLARRRASSDLEEGRATQARRPREGAPQVRPQEGPQGAAVLEALKRFRAAA